MCTVYINWHIWSTTFGESADQAIKHHHFLVQFDKFHEFLMTKTKPLSPRLVPGKLIDEWTKVSNET